MSPRCQGVPSKKGNRRYGSPRLDWQIEVSARPWNQASHQERANNVSCEGKRIEIAKVSNVQHANRHHDGDVP